MQMNKFFLAEEDSTIYNIHMYLIYYVKVLF